MTSVENPGGIEVLTPGLLTSVQDEGRFGKQRIGLSPAGAMDTYSFAAANVLVGNPVNTGVLECTLMGPSLRFNAANVIAVTGADMSPTLEGVPIPQTQTAASRAGCAGVPLGRAVFVPAGSVLRLGAAKSGCRTYIAFQGGLDIPVTDGSQSTLIRSATGGFHGRKLAAGDKICFRAPGKSCSSVSIPPQTFSKDITVRVVLGPQEDRFTKAGIETFLNNAYTVTPQSDRMAYRLENPNAKIEHTTDANIISDGIPLGAVQVPGSGQPIIMMAEHQGSGGYTKIANVISADIPLIAQCPPGGTIRFRAISVEESQDIYMERRAELSRLAAAAQLLSQREVKYAAVRESVGIRTASLWRVTVDGTPMTVSVTPID